MRDVSKMYMAIGSNGETVHGLTWPRKELLERLGRQHADKVYVGDGVHVGYIIARVWWTIYRVEPWSGTGGENV